MPDPNLTLTAVQSHTTALDGAIRRHITNSGWFKMGSAVAVLGVVLLASGKAQMAALPWAAGVVILLAFADACQVVMARVCTDAYNGFMRKLPLNGGNAMKAEECFVLPAPEPGWRQAGQVLGALGSLSVLPFYGALLALVVAFHVQMAGDGGGAKAARLLTSSATKGGCSAGGGCGTSGGCGSGGCGASSGKGCGCGSEAAGKKAPSALGAAPSASGKAQSVTVKPAPTPVSSSLRMNVIPNAGNPGMPARPNGIPFGQPGQPPALAPLRPVPPQPGVRLPTQPPPRIPTNGVPAITAPVNGSPLNGVPANTTPVNGLLNGGPLPAPGGSDQ